MRINLWERKVCFQLFFLQLQNFHLIHQQIGLARWSEAEIPIYREQAGLHAAFYYVRAVAHEQISVLFVRFVE